MGIAESAAAFVLGAAAAFFGTTVGGGGLLAIPGLIFLGLPPHAAVATTRLGALAMIAAGLLRFARSGKVDWRVGIYTGVLALSGAVVGARMLLQTPEALLEPIIGLLLLSVLLLLAAKDRIGIEPPPPGPLRRRLGYLSYLPLGFWGGYFGAGYGIASSYAMVLLFGKTFLEAAATRKAAGAAVTTVSLAMFIHAGAVAWQPGVWLFTGMAAGSYAGASFALARGERWVRRLFIIVAALSAVRLLLP